MSEKLIEKSELESDQGATLKIERIILSSYASSLLRAQPAAKSASRCSTTNDLHDQRVQVGTGRAIESTAQ
ncbi:hypothetical protein PHO31112_05102 [Pandoraea horticolens]|uniref:Uncharacterized protein n=1 Tax=Pandoraea horticolens TaxID=2508298 RepID=A0A5E4Z686_9BURK|nr:hypothetical protein PHO31112_05102 [Pandoraea horticolens]